MIEFAVYGEKHDSLFTLASWGEFGKVKTIELVDDGIPYYPTA